MGLKQKLNRLGFSLSFFCLLSLVVVGCKVPQDSPEKTEDAKVDNDANTSDAALPNADWVKHARETFQDVKIRFFEDSNIKDKDDLFYVKKIIATLQVNKPLDKYTKNQIKIARDDYQLSLGGKDGRTGFLIRELGRIQDLYTLIGTVTAYRTINLLDRSAVAYDDHKIKELMNKVIQAYVGHSVLHLRDPKLVASVDFIKGVPFPEVTDAAYELLSRVLKSVAKVKAESKISEKADLDRFQLTMMILSPYALLKSGDSLEKVIDDFDDPKTLLEQIKTIYADIFDVLADMESLSVAGAKVDFSNQLNHLANLLIQEQKAVQSLYQSSEMQLGSATQVLKD